MGQDTGVFHPGKAVGSGQGITDQLGCPSPGTAGTSA